MLRTRLIVGTLLIVALVALCWLDHRATVPGAWLLPLLIAFTLLATHELMAIFAAKGIRPPVAAVYTGNLLMVLRPWAAWAWENAGASGVAGPSGPAASCLVADFGLGALALAAAIALFIEMAKYDGPGRCIENVGAAAFAVVYVGVMLSFAVRLRLEWGVEALASLVIVVKMGDTGAYFCGKAFGRHRMSPRLSPNKTIEGGIGGILVSMAASWAVFQWLVPLASQHAAVPRSASTVGALGFGLVLGLVGMAGDLAESLLKRDAACKDSSAWVPGLGGVLDILDSVLLAAPVAFFAWCLGWTG